MRREMINHWIVDFSPKIRSFVHLIRQKEYSMWKTIFDHRWGLIFPIAKTIDDEEDDIALISILSLSLLIFINDGQSTRCICPKIIHLFRRHRTIRPFIGRIFCNDLIEEANTLDNAIELLRQRRKMSSSDLWGKTLPVRYISLEISKERVSPSTIDSMRKIPSQSLPTILNRSSLILLLHFVESTLRREKILCSSFSSLPKWRQILLVTESSSIDWIRRSSTAPQMEISSLFLLQPEEKTSRRTNLFLSSISLKLSFSTMEDILSLPNVLFPDQYQLISDGSSVFQEEEESEIFFVSTDQFLVQTDRSVLTSSRSKIFERQVLLFLLVHQGKRKEKAKCLHSDEDEQIVEHFLRFSSRRFSWKSCPGVFHRSMGAKDTSQGIRRRDSFLVEKDLSHWSMNSWRRKLHQRRTTIGWLSLSSPRRTNQSKQILRKNFLFRWKICLGKTIQRSKRNIEQWMSKSMSDRFCSDMLPTIDHRFRCLKVQSTSMERLWLAADDSNWSQLHIFICWAICAWTQILVESFSARHCRRSRENHRIGTWLTLEWTSIVIMLKWSMTASEG